jgi:hypothetical protein
MPIEVNGESDMIGLIFVHPCPWRQASQIHHRSSLPEIELQYWSRIKRDDGVLLFLERHNLASAILLLGIPVKQG